MIRVKIWATGQTVGDQYFHYHRMRVTFFGLTIYYREIVT